MIAHLHVSTDAVTALHIGGEMYDTGIQPYEGDYEFTPTEYTQTAQTADRKLAGDIVINPIPSNYGRIAWDGTGIIVY